MKLTIEELRKVYDDAWMSILRDHTKTHPLEGAILAVARFAAERQRAVEPTEEMRNVLASSVSNNRTIDETLHGLAAVAPPVVPE